MQIPDNYPSELRDIIMAHTKHGIIPSWFIVHYLDIAEDFNTFIEGLTHKPESILDIGGLSLPILHEQTFEKVTLLEPRAHYKDVAKDLYDSADIDIIETIGERLSYDLVLINMDLGGLEINTVKSQLNTKFLKDLPVYGYRYHNRHRPDYGQGFMDDGYVYDADLQASWQKEITNHMHLGIKKHAFNKMTLLDLTRFY